MQVLTIVVVVHVFPNFSPCIVQILSAYVWHIIFPFCCFCTSLVYPTCACVLLNLPCKILNACSLCCSHSSHVVPNGSTFLSLFLAKSPSLFIINNYVILRVVRDFGNLCGVHHVLNNLVFSNHKKQKGY